MAEAARTISVAEADILHNPMKENARESAGPSASQEVNCQTEEEIGCYRTCLETAWMQRVFRHDTDFLLWPTAVMFALHSIEEAGYPLNAHVALRPRTIPG